MAGWTKAAARVAYGGAVTVHASGRVEPVRHGRRHGAAAVGRTEGRVDDSGSPLEALRYPR